MLNDRNILNCAGKISQELALQHVSNEYDRFHHQRLLDEAIQADAQDFETLAEQVSEQNNEKEKEQQRER